MDIARLRGRVPTRASLKELTRAGRVAYVVRCAERVFPFFEHWTEKQYGARLFHARNVATAILKAHAVACDPTSTDVALAAAVAAQAAARAASAARASSASDAQTARNAAGDRRNKGGKRRIAYSAAANQAFLAAGAASDAYVAADTAAFDIATFDADTSRRAGLDAEWRFLQSVISDFDYLLALTKNSNLPEHTGIDSKSLGPLWVGGPPRWYYASELWARPAWSTLC